MSKTVFIALPSRGVHVTGALPALVACSDRKRGYTVIQSGFVHSLLTRSFNTLWCRALNMNPRPDYFAMMHDDVCPEPYWLDTLIDELEVNKADVVSAFIAIKDHTGETSTCFHKPAINTVDRISQKQADELPETFGEEHLPEGVKLLLNTGLWVCKFKDCKLIKDGDIDVAPWTERFSFGQSDNIVKGDEGYQAFATTEDWEASMRWNNWGLKTMATRKIRIGHVGTFTWTYGGKDEHDPNSPLQQVGM